MTIDEAQEALHQYGAAMSESARAAWYFVWAAAILGTGRGKLVADDAARAVRGVAPADRDGVQQVLRQIAEATEGVQL